MQGAKRLNGAKRAQVWLAKGDRRKKLLKKTSVEYFDRQYFQRSIFHSDSIKCTFNCASRAPIPLFRLSHF